MQQKQEIHFYSQIFFNHLVQILNVKYSIFYNMYIKSCCVSEIYTTNCFVSQFKCLFKCSPNVPDVQSLQVPQLLYVTDELLWQSELHHHILAALQEVVQAFTCAGGAVSGPWAGFLLLLRSIQVHFFGSPAAVCFFTSSSTAA